LNERLKKLTDDPDSILYAEQHKGDTLWKEKIIRSGLPHINRFIGSQSFMKSFTAKAGLMW
jgi:hypothetical protein